MFKYMKRNLNILTPFKPRFSAVFDGLYRLYLIQLLLQQCFFGAAKKGACTSQRLRLRLGTGLLFLVKPYATIDYIHSKFEE